MKGKQIYLYLLVCLMTWVSLPASARVTTEFDKAMQWIEEEQWEKASRILEALIEGDKNYHRARIELASAYGQLEQFENALAQIDYVLSVATLPENVKVNIQQMQQKLLQQYQSKKSTGKPIHAFSSSIELGLGFDDNVQFTSAEYFANDDPLVDGFFVEEPDGSLSFFSPDGYAYDLEGNQLYLYDTDLDFGERELDTPFIDASLIGTYTYQLSNHISWKTSLQLQAIRNSEFKQFDRLQGKLTSQLKWTLSDQSKLILAVNHRVLSRDSAVQVISSGIQPSWQYFSQWGKWEFGVGYLDRDYRDTEFVRGDFVSIFSGFKSQTRLANIAWSNVHFDGALFLLGKVEVSKVNSALENEDYNGLKTSIAAVWKMSEQFKWSLSLQQLALDYAQLNVMDTSVTTKSKLTYQYSESLDIVLSGERSVRDSEVFGGIKSDKSLLKLSIRKTF